MSTPLTVLRLSDVVKTYPGVVALKGVSFDVVGGEVHALVGENGAGKSTLMGVAAGSILPDQGTVEIGGHVMEHPSPAAAQALGLAVVYQQTSVLEDLTVAENMVFAMPPGRRPAMAHAQRWARVRLDVVGAAVDPETRVSQLGAADRQLVEIAKALALESRVLLLDEPTESLTSAESELLFARIQAIKRAGTGVVYISHRLPEVKRIADRLTVLRDGEVRGTFAAADVSTGEILGLIVGRSIDRVFPPKWPASAVDQEPLFEVRALTGGRFRDVSVTVAPGEIVGVAGVEGNGQREFVRALAGLLPAQGELLVAGQAVEPGDPTRARTAGIVHLPGDRHREGLFLSLSVRENIALLALPRASALGLVRRSRERAMVQPQIERLAIKVPSPEVPAATLSGGNQQKALIARSLLSEPRVLVADEPTRGVDMGARVELYGILRSAAAAGQAIVVASSDALELQGLCDRVLVFSRGVVVRTLTGDAITESNITGAAITAERGVDEAAARTSRLRRLSRFAGGDYAPSLILMLLIIVLGAFTWIRNDAFLSDRSIASMLLLTSALAFASLGQAAVIFVGGFDLSIGPLIGLVVIIISTLIPEGAGTVSVVVGLGAAVLVGALVGLANGVLVRAARLAPVLATLATFIVIQGVSLLLRPKPQGLIDEGFIAGIKATVGPIPVMFVAVVVISVLAEWGLRRARWGLELRAVGSDEGRAHRLGARVTSTHLAAYLACSMCAVAAGVVLAALVGIGQASLGSGYTLTSITAVVLGGASIFGGRGSFVGAVVGAVLLQEIVTASSFLDFGRAWQFWLPGVLILVAAAAYSRARRTATAATDPGLAG